MNEARFQGARRVQNALNINSASENFATWSKGVNATCVGTSVSWTGAGSIGAYGDNSVYTVSKSNAGDTARMTFKIRSATGANQKFRLVVSNNVTADLTATPVDQIFSTMAG
jgi:hypothetical protein